MKSFLNASSSLTSILIILLLTACSSGQDTADTDEEEKSNNDTEEKASDEGGIGKRSEKIDSLRNKMAQNKKWELNSEEGFLYHERTACFGHCPVYTLRVQKNGDAELQVERFKELKEGNYEGRLKEEDLEAIEDKARKIGFFEYDKVYDKKQVTDLPSRITEIRTEGRHHRVRNRYQGPKELEELEKLIQKIMKRTEWKEVPSNE